VSAVTVKLPGVELSKEFELKVADLVFIVTVPNLLEMNIFSENVILEFGLLTVSVPPLPPI
jgi:hypothetical protein